MSASSSGEWQTCPECGGWDPGMPRAELPEGARYCTPLSCSAWKFTHRLTKQGAKPIRPDGRADLTIAPRVAASEERA